MFTPGISKHSAKPAIGFIRNRKRIGTEEKKVCVCGGGGGVEGLKDNDIETPVWRGGLKMENMIRSLSIVSLCQTIS